MVLIYSEMVSAVVRCNLIIIQGRLARVPSQYFFSDFTGGLPWSVNNQYHVVHPELSKVKDIFDCIGKKPKDFSES